MKHVGCVLACFFFFLSSCHVSVPAQERGARAHTEWFSWTARELIITPRFRSAQPIRARCAAAYKPICCRAFPFTVPAVLWITDPSCIPWSTATVKMAARVRCINIYIIYEYIHNILVFLFGKEENTNIERKMSGERCLPSDWKQCLDLYAPECHRGSTIFCLFHMMLQHCDPGICQEESFPQALHISSSIRPPAAC